jgi:hypothetical protein
MGSTTWGIFMAGAGLFSVLGGALDWDFFINAPKARFFVETLGRGGARAFYVLLGLLLIGGGVAALTGVLPIGRQAQASGLSTYRP